MKLAQCHCCHIELAKASHVANQVSECGEMSSASWREELQCPLQGVWVPRGVENWGQCLNRSTIQCDLA